MRLPATICATERHASDTRCGAGVCAASPINPPPSANDSAETAVLITRASNSISQTPRPALLAPATWYTLAECAMPTLPSYESRHPSRGNRDSAELGWRLLSRLRIMSTALRGAHLGSRPERDGRSARPTGPASCFAPGSVFEAFACAPHYSARPLTALISRTNSPIVHGFAKYAVLGIERSNDRASLLKQAPVKRYRVVPSSSGITTLEMTTSIRP